MSHPMRDWQDERTRGTKTYFETNLWGMEWTGFGKPRPFIEIHSQAARCDPQSAGRGRLGA